MVSTPDPVDNLMKKVDLLGEALRLLRIQDSTRLLNSISTEVKDAEAFLSLAGEYRAKLLLYFALGGDLNGKYLSTLEQMHAAIEGILAGANAALPGSSLTVWELSALELSKGIVKFHAEEYDNARRILNSARRYVHRMRDTEMALVLQYYLARCHWRRGNYDKAIFFAGKAREMEKQMANSNRIALIDLLEGYLLLLSGDYLEADRLLKEAKQVLERTDDHINHGNSVSFQGQLLRRKGQYPEAAEAFRRADRIYNQHPGVHRNRARCQANLAAALRLEAHRKERQRASKDELFLLSNQARSLRMEALTNLTVAEGMYRSDSKAYLKGLGKCHYIRALCYLDDNRFVKAAGEATRAYSYGRKSKDTLLMARACITQCVIKLEEASELDEETFDAARVYKDAKKALEYAKKSNNRRVQARAHICLGRTLLRAPFCHQAAAKQELSAAASLLVKEEQDYVREEIETLRDEIKAFKGSPNKFCVTAGNPKNPNLKGLIKNLAVYHLSVYKTKKATAEVLGITERKLRNILADGDATNGKEPMVE